MQTTNFRYLLLIGLLLVSAGLYARFGGAQANSGTPRWPDAEELYAADAWSTGPPVVEHNTDAGHNTDFVTRTFRNPAGRVATLTVVTSQAPKLYGAGAEVPFLGTGYTVVAAPPEIVPADNRGVNALVAQRGTEQWLVMYTYGERRGLLGNGPLPWTLAVFDGILGQPNDYYKMYLAVRNDHVEAELGPEVAALAHTLFPRIAAWYAA